VTPLPYIELYIYIYAFLLFYFKKKIYIIEVWSVFFLFLHGYKGHFICLLSDLILNPKCRGDIAKF